MEINYDTIEQLFCQKTVTAQTSKTAPNAEKKAVTEVGIR